MMVNFLGGVLVRNLPSNAGHSEDAAASLDQEDPLE